MALQEVKAMRLFFFLRFDTPELDSMSQQWENAAADYVVKKFSNNTVIKVLLIASRNISRHTSSTHESSTKASRTMRTD